MYKLLCCIIFLCGAENLIAQNNLHADSLLRALDMEQTDTGRMNGYNKLANYYMYNNASKAIEYFEKAKTIAVEKGLQLKTANNFYSIGYCYLTKADFEKSLINYQQSVKIYEKLQDSFRLSNALMSIGNVYFQYKDRKKTNEYYEKAEKLVLIMNDSQQLATIYDSRGMAYDQLGSYDSALIYAYKAYNITRLIKDTDYAMSILSNIGLNYKHLFKTEQALSCFDTVKVYFEKTNAPADRMGPLYNNIAATHAQAGNYMAALEAFHKSIGYAKQTGSPTIEMENYRNMADMFGNMKDYAQQANYLKQYYHLKDSIYTIESKNQLTELESDYQLGKKNIELAKQETELIKQKNQRNVFIIVAIAAAILLAAGSFTYSRIQKSNQELTQKNGQINQQKNELQTLNHVKDRLFSIISHDLRNPLATLRSYLSLADNDALAPEKKQQFKLQTMNAVINTGDMLDNLLAWANVQIKNTNPPLVPVNIADVVWDTVHSVEAQALQKQISIQQQIQATTAVGDYDILSIALRNLVTNAIKYSNANKSIYVISSRENDKVIVTVKDEGIGLSPQQIEQVLQNENNSTTGTHGEKGSGLGLFLVRELLQKINAELKIESEVGMGSRFMIVMEAI